MTKQNEEQEPVFPIEHHGIEGMSQFDYACIHLKVPKTGKVWLDALITESLRHD